jgi:hypothetical protein
MGRNLSLGLCIKAAWPCRAEASSSGRFVAILQWFKHLDAGTGARRIVFGNADPTAASYLPGDDVAFVYDMPSDYTSQNDDAARGAAVEPGNTGSTRALDNLAAPILREA